MPKKKLKETITTKDGVKRTYKIREDTGKKAVGRPTNITPEIVNKLESILRIDGTISQACAYAGISRETYYSRAKKDKVFADRMADAKEYMYILAKKTLSKGIKDGDTKAAIEFLKRREKKYKDKIEQETTVTVSIADLTYDEGLETTKKENVK